LRVITFPLFDYPLAFPPVLSKRPQSWQHCGNAFCQWQRCDSCMDPGVWWTTTFVTCCGDAWWGSSQLGSIPLAVSGQVRLCQTLDRDGRCPAEIKLRLTIPSLPASP